MAVVLGVPVTGLAVVMSAVPFPFGMLLAVPGIPLVITALLLQIWVLRVVIPRLEPGTEPFPDSRLARLWLASFLLKRVALHPWWAPVVIGSPTLRWLALTA